MILAIPKNTINRLLEKKHKIITYQPKTFENPNIADIESVITEHTKTLHKLYKGPESRF